MTDFVDPIEEPLDRDRDPDAPFDPDLNEDLINSAEADRLAAEHRADVTDEGDSMDDTAPVEKLE